MRRKFIAIPVIFLFALSGCANIAKQAPPGVTHLSSGEEALIFGRIRWIQNGEERESYSDITLSVLRVEDMKKGSIAVERDGAFYGLLPKGTYVIHELNWRDSWSGPYWLVPKVAFKAEEDRHLYYLGTLVVDLRASRDIIGGLRIKEFAIHIEDEEDKARSAFRERYPNQDGEMFKALMVHDQHIPRIRELEVKKGLLDFILRTLPMAPVLIIPR